MYVPSSLIRLKKQFTRLPCFESPTSKHIPLTRWTHQVLYTDIWDQPPIHLYFFILFNLSSSSYTAAGHHSLWRWPGHPSTTTYCPAVAAPPAHPAPEQVNPRTPLRLRLPPLRFVRSEVSTSSSAFVLSPWHRRLSFPTWSAKQEESGDNCSSRG